jgi:hypothetical protein
MAEYYRSLDDAEAYFDDQLFVADWTTKPDADKVKALTAAARAIDSLRWKGFKVPVYDALEADASATIAALEAADATQAKAWPRDSDTMVKDTASTVATVLQWTANPTAGNFTLTIEVNHNDGTTDTFTTAAIAFDAAAATIETAIDVAATAASVTGWTNGDIAVAGGPLDAADVTLTSTGSNNVRPVVATDATFDTDGTAASPASTVAVSGECPDRLFWAQCEEAITLLSGRDPKQEFENAVLTSDGVGSSRSSSDRGQMPPVHTQHFFTSARAWAYLAKFLDNKESDSFRFERK